MLKKPVASMVDSEAVEAAGQWVAVIHTEARSRAVNIRLAVERQDITKRSPWVEPPGCGQSGTTRLADHGGTTHDLTRLGQDISIVAIGLGGKNARI